MKIKPAFLLLILIVLHQTALLFAQSSLDDSKAKKRNSPSNALGLSKDIKQKLLICRYEDYHPDAEYGKRVAFKRIEDYSCDKRFGHSIVSNHEAFLECCATGRPWHQDMLDIWKSHVVCLAAERSAMEDFQKIEIDYSPPGVEA